MLDQTVPLWPRPYFEAGTQPTKIFFVCFGKAPLGDVETSRARFGLPSVDLLSKVDLREHQRAQNRAWFEGWWAGSFGSIAQRDLGDDLPLLTTSDVCFTLGLELPDVGDLSPVQTIWGLTRWLCARGCSVVLDVHAFQFRTRQDIDALAFDAGDVERDVKLVLETEPTRDGLHLFHTRGLCKFGRPELLCFLRPDDIGLMGRVANQIARALMEGALASRIRLKVAEGVEITATPAADEGSLLHSLGLEAAVVLGRGDGQPLAGVGRLVPVP
jgi:hypothetical protein